MTDFIKLLRSLFLSPVSVEHSVSFGFDLEEYKAVNGGLTPFDIGSGYDSEDEDELYS